MKKVFYIFLFLLIALSFLGVYYVTGGNKMSFIEDGSALPTPTPYLSAVNLDNCREIDPENYNARAELVQKIRVYLERKENKPITTDFIGKMIPETKCYHLLMGELEIYQDRDENLVILKNGQIFKMVPVRDWKVE